MGVVNMCVCLQHVVLDRSIGRLGLSIVGGADHVSRVFGQGRPGLYVSKVTLLCCFCVVVVFLLTSPLLF